MRKVGLCIIVLILMFPVAALAHVDGKHSERAPDLHPIFVLIEFAVVLWIGYLISCWLTRLGRGK
jgi:bacteriorhodopsin